jgi:hypothetical protein
VDENYFYGDVDQLKAYGKPAPGEPTAEREPGKAPRFLILKDMMARSAPSLAAVKFTKNGPMYVYRGAVLNGMGKHTAHWVQVMAGGAAVWLYLGNTKAV